jgi:hypothetical protein
MLKRLSAALLLGGLFLGLTPTTASAYDDGHRDDHYRCMYRCAERGYGGGYDRGGYDRSRRDRVYHNGQCFEHDDSGWHRCGYRRYRYYDRRYSYDRGYYDRGYYDENDSAHASGGYDSHRHHPRNW